ncbi:MAG: hypothetical protein IPI98_00220 [Chitinophagaceae bacterium]|nr:hypothetical protein [Chitinophagaceae bacterium]
MQQQAQSMAKDLMTALREDRKSETGSDLFRSIIFMVLAAGVLWFALKNKYYRSCYNLNRTLLNRFNGCGYPLFKQHRFYG